MWVTAVRTTGILHVRSPESKVVPEELHDEGGVLVALFR